MITPTIPTRKRKMSSVCVFFFCGGVGAGGMMCKKNHKSLIVDSFEVMFFCISRFSSGKGWKMIFV